MAKNSEIVQQEAAIRPYSLQQSILTIRAEQVILNEGSQSVIPVGYNFGGTTKQQTKYNSNFFV